MANKLIAESGTQLLARLSSRPSLKDLDNVLFPKGLIKGDIVQISGNSGTGKSLLLLHLLTKCLLPKFYKNIHIGGFGVGVILIDTDHNISVLKLASLMEQFISNSFHCAKNSVSIRTQLVEEILKESLNRLIILKTYSSMQLQMNFFSLAKILSNNSDVALLMVDSLTSFYWEDTTNPKHYKKMDLYLKVMLENMLKCISDFKIVTIFVKQDYFQSKNSDIKLPQINHRIELRKTEKNSELFCAFIDSIETSYNFSISDKGLIWIIQ